MQRHPAIFAYLIGNEIPPDMVRWHGPARVRDFLKRLADLVKSIDPEAAGELRQFPSTGVTSRSISATSSASTSISTRRPPSAAIVAAA